MAMVSNRLGIEGDQQMKCCNYDCNQGRDCPHRNKNASIGDIAFTVLMAIITGVIAVSIMWWVITAVMLIVESIK
jgi:hypothetical protein